MGLVEQIQRERLRLGWSVQVLLEKSGLDIERSTLHRKLDGDSPMTDAECQALAQAMDLTLVWPKPGESATAA